MAVERRSNKRSVLYRAEERGQPGLYEVEYEAVNDALHFACRDLRAGRRRPLEIVEDGVLIYDAEQIAAQCRSDPTLDALEAEMERQTGRPRE